MDNIKKQKERKIEAFDPNGLAVNDSLFGLPFSFDESDLIVLPIPWEVTVSYRAGTAKAPEAIKEASLQVDLYDPYLHDSWKRGVYMDVVSPSIAMQNKALREKSELYLERLESEVIDKSLQKEINTACENLVAEVEQMCSYILNKNKLVALLGGDHSVPLGFLKALSKRYDSFGILQIDAHADLRDSYEGFEYSHASIMYNALKIKEVEKLVQVGIRDYCESENEFIKNNDSRVKCFFDKDIKHNLYLGASWKSQVDAIVNELPNNVYLSFDIDGLDPKLCPNTGTPVAGGFEVEEILFLVEQVIASGRKLIGFDLNEVAPGEDEWDANVAARLLFRLSNILLACN